MYHASGLDRAGAIVLSPQDVAFNVSAPPADGPLARNWIGPVGAYGADLLFQISVSRRFCSPRPF